MGRRCRGGQGRLQAVCIKMRVYPSQLRLVQDGLGDRGVRVGGEAPDGLVGVPVRPEQIRTQVPDEGVLLPGRDQCDVVQVVPDRDGVGGT